MSSASANPLVLWYQLTAYVKELVPDVKLVHYEPFFVNKPHFRRETLVYHRDEAPGPRIEVLRSGGGESQEDATLRLLCGVSVLLMGEEEGLSTFTGLSTAALHGHVIARGMKALGDIWNKTGGHDFSWQSKFTSYVHQYGPTAWEDENLSEDEVPALSETTFTVQFREGDDLASTLTAMAAQLEDLAAMEREREASLRRDS